MKILLDTHAWIWWATASSRLSARARQSISKASKNGEILLSSISVWEVAKLVEKGRLILDRDTEVWCNEALKFQKIRLVPLSPSIACKACSLPQPFHNDPADQIIVATSLVEEATIITADNCIREYPHCQSIW